MFAANNLEPYFEILAEKSWVILPIQTEFARALLNSSKSKLQSFRSAGITQTPKRQGNLRGDNIYWLDEKDETLTKTDRAALGELNGLRLQLHDYFRIGLHSFECHYSHYEAGQFYVRHRDITQQNNQRQFSFVLYLNFDWSAQDGGELVGYSEESFEIFRVRPEAGQMILFKSDVEHEVETAHRSRYALTGWMRSQ